MTIMKVTLVSAGLALLAIGAVAPAFAVTASQAEQAALQAYPGGKVTAPAELEDEDGVQVYGVHVTAADGKMYDVKVDAATGKILKSDPDDPGGTEGGGESGQENEAGTAGAPRHAAKILSATLTPAQAVAAAVAVQPGTATTVELEDENGTSVYGVHLTDKNGQKYDVKVDASTGKVLKSESDAPGGGEAAGTEAPEQSTETPSQQMARIMSAGLTPLQAQTAALAAQPGTVTQVELEDENGTAVYGVHITAADGKMYDVKVDATTGKVLKSELDNGSEGAGQSGEGDTGGEADAGGGGNTDGGGNTGDQTNN